MATEQQVIKDQDRPDAADDQADDTPDPVECDRCKMRDGRSLQKYEMVDKAGERRFFCDECAAITQEHHKIKPRARVAKAAPVEDAKAETAAPVNVGRR